MKTINETLKGTISAFCDSKRNNADELISKIEAAGYAYHHTARQKGYVPSRRYFVDTYNGRYGKGFIVKFPNNESERHSNNYYDIRYYIKASENNVLCNNIALSPYHVHWIEFVPTKGIVTKHDRKILGGGYLPIEQKGAKQCFVHMGSKENALAYIDTLRGKKLSKHYTCYIFTDKQFGMAKVEHCIVTIPYTKKQIAEAIFL